MVDWKRNNKCAIRNPDVACDSHDVVKLMIMRMLRRAHGDSSKIQIESESPTDNTNFPDVIMSIPTGRNQEPEVCNWEIQKNISKEWRDLKNQQYNGADWIEVDLNKINSEIEQKTGWTLDEYISNLRVILESQGVIV